MPYKRKQVKSIYWLGILFVLIVGVVVTVMVVVVVVEVTLVVLRLRSTGGNASVVPNVLLP